MADFCKQCSIDMFGEDMRDLAGLGEPGTVLEEGYGYSVICEGCGPTLVNEEGECIVDDCMEEGHTEPHSFGVGQATMRQFPATVPTESVPDELSV